jgi:hypothetical protein
MLLHVGGIWSLTPRDYETRSTRRSQRPVCSFRLVARTVWALPKGWAPRSYGTVSCLCYQDLG